MSLPSSDEEKNDLLRKLLDFTFENLESIIPEFHEKKNQLNYLRIIVKELENSLRQDKTIDVSKKINELIKGLSESMNDLNDVYYKLNHNPAKLHGYVATLKKFCFDCSKKYNLEVEFDTTGGEIDKVPLINPGIYPLCVAAIETICIQGHKNVYVLLSKNKAKLEIKISGHGKKQALNLSEESIINTNQMLQSLIAWKKPLIKPETDWQNVIWLELEGA